MKRRRSLARVLGLAVVAASAAAAACGGSGSGASDGGVEAPAVVSFQSDLLPKFAMSCGLSSSCHHDPVQDPTVQRIFLGCDPASPSCSVPTPAPTVRRELMGPSQEDPTMPYVTPGDPTKSYLVYKLEGNLKSPALQCIPLAMDPILEGAPGEMPTADQPCGASMPLGGGMLADVTTLVRAWIVQGAMDN